MTPTQKVQLKQSKSRERLSELLKIEERSEAETAEMAAIADETLPGLEVELRAAIASEAETGKTADPDEGTAAEPGIDPKRVELRGRCSLAQFFQAAVSGQSLSGAEAELAAEIGLGSRSIPLEMFGVETRAVETRADAPSAAPGTVGVNLMSVVPSIFARSVAPRLGVTMPRVPSGTFAVPRITTDLTAAAKAKGDAQESTAAVLTVATTTPHRVSARLTISLEDIAAVGTDSFEMALRQNLSLALSAKLDQFALRTGSGAQPHGLMNGLTDPADPTDVAVWLDWVKAVSGGIDGGPWAETMADVRLLVNAEAMRLAEDTFRVGVGDPTKGVSTPGEMSAAAYLRAESGGFFSSSRMPDTATNISQALRYRPGTMGLDGVDAMTTAVCPVWSEVGIDDIYTDAASGQRHVTFHVLLGDVIKTQPDAYERIDLKVS